MAKAGIKTQAVGPVDGVLVINEVQSGDSVFLQKGYEASYTSAQGGTFVKGDFVKVKIKRHPMGGYYAGGNLTKVTCSLVVEMEDKKADLNGKKGIIVVKNPDAIVELAPPSGSGDHAGNILSNSAEKGDFVTFTISNNVIDVTGILTDCA